jgi:hypothetical protein
MTFVNEKTSLILTLEFTDEDGLPIIPDSGTYRIDDVESGVEVQVDTPFDPGASTFDIEIAYTKNVIINSVSSSERKRVTITILYNTDKQCTTEFIYSVKNLTKIR